MKQKSKGKRILSGIFLLLLIHVVVILTLRILAYIILIINPTVASYLIFSLFYIGLLQLLYVIPIAILLKRKRQPSKMKGVIIGAVITFLFNIIVLVLWLTSFR